MYSANVGTKQSNRLKEGKGLAHCWREIEKKGEKATLWEESKSFLHELKLTIKVF